MLSAYGGHGIRLHFARFAHIPGEGYRHSFPALGQPALVLVQCRLLRGVYAVRVGRLCRLHREAELAIGEDQLIQRRVLMPRVEVGIAVSAIMLGLMVALAVRAPLALAIAVVSAFAIFHGHAHGAELPRGADAIAFSAGFVVATGLLHVCGIGLGLATHWPAGRLAVRLVGAGIAGAGAIFLRAALSL